jgi:acyl carrier protein
MIQTSVVFGAENVGSWKVTTNEGKKIHACGSFQLQLSSSTISKFNIIYPIISHRIASITSGRDGKVFTTSSIYQVFFPRVVTYGRHYRCVQILTTSADGMEGYASIQLPSNSDRDRFVVHPILMDAMLHVAGFMANTGGDPNDAFICNKVGFLEVIPRLIDDSAPYGVYINCTRLPGGDVLAESYTLGHDSANQVVAHIEGIYFRKVPLTTLEHGLTLAAGSILPETLKLEGTIQSSTSSITLPCSQHLYEVKPRVQGSDSRDLTTSVTSSVSRNLDSLPIADSGALSLPRSAINTETGGTALESPCGKPEILPQNAPEERLSFPGDNPCPSSDVKPLLAAVLGLEMNELREDIDLELLGLDSLASIEAHHALQSHFYIVLPSDFFTTHTSVKAIQSFITSRLAASCKDPNGCTRSYSTDIVPPIADRSELAGFYDPVPISVQQTGKTGRTPLFLIHDGSGLVKYTDNLPPFGRDLWGIHNPNFMNSRPWESVESMAAEYAKYMIKAAGKGPVLVGGLDLISSEMCC